MATLSARLKAIEDQASKPIIRFTGFRVVTTPTPGRVPIGAGGFYLAQKNNG